jgi:hypothetical protein
MAGSRQAVFYDHVSIAAPSRSGTTHLTIETILQGEGWDKGWRTIKEMAGNFRTITDRSFGVPEAVNSGQVGVGIVIDFFAFSAQASRLPGQVRLSVVTTVVPANVGIVANAPEQGRAEAFIEFLLSPAGQEVLLEPGIRRLPVNPASTPRPADYPNPFTDPRFQKMIGFDVDKSEEAHGGRRHAVRPADLVPARPLKGVTKALHEVDAALAKKAEPAGQGAGRRGARPDRGHAGHRDAGREPETARRLHRRQGEGRAPGRGRAAVGSFARDNYAKAKAKAEEALKAASTDVCAQSAPHACPRADRDRVDKAPLTIRRSWRRSVTAGPVRRHRGDCLMTAIASIRAPAPRRPRPARSRWRWRSRLFLMFLVLPVATVIYVAFTEKGTGDLHARQFLRLLPHRAVHALVVELVLCRRRCRWSGPRSSPCRWPI